MSNKSNRAAVSAVAVTLASITAERELLNQQAAALDAKEAGIKQETENKIKALFDNLPVQMSAILGRGVNAGEAVSSLRKHIEGKSLFSPATAGTNADKGKRLTPEQDMQVRQLMLQRQLDIKAGKAPMTISAIAAQFDVGSQTISNRAPSTAEIDAGKLIEAPAPAAVAAV